MNRTLAAAAAAFLVASCSGGQSYVSPASYVPPVDANQLVHDAEKAYAKALVNSDNATIATYRPHLKQSDIDECKAREDMVDVIQYAKRDLVLDHCLSAAANRNQGR